MARHTVLHIGDTHLHPGPRQQDRVAALNQILLRAHQLAAAGDLAAVLWPGDFFHQKSTPEDRNILAGFLQSFARLAPVVGVYGNHDVPGDLEVFTRISAPWPITIVDTPQVLRMRLATNHSAAIFSLPYPHRAGIVSAGAAHAEIAQTAEQALDAIFQQMAEELIEARGEGFLPLTIGHINVGGAVLSSGQPNIGAEIELTPALLERLPSGPVALNHIHKHQRLQDRAVYAGSIARMDFGENEEKGYVEWTYDDSIVEVEDGLQWTWRFMPLDVPQQLHVDGELTRDGFKCDENDHYMLTHSGADIRVRYRYLKADAGVIDVDQIRSIFSGARSLKLEGVPQLTHEMRAPEIAAAVTLDEKVVLYCERHGIAVTDGLRGKLSSLQSGDPAEVLQALGFSLSAAGATPAAERAVA